METPRNCILAIFGASGDLTSRKLIPSLFSLYCKNLLPEGFAVLGVSRSELDDLSFRDKMAESLSSPEIEDPARKEKAHEFLKKLYYLAIDTKNPEEYPRVKSRIESLDSQYQVGGNYIYYLAISPGMYEIIAENLGACGLQTQISAEEHCKRIIVEKPFGCDLQSARDLNNHLLKIFSEKQIYRIDHYLGKETVQNILVFRFSNGIFEPLWNRNYVHHIEITAAESLGVEKRGKYYDGTGALRDMVQNHLLQLLGTVAMEPPSTFGPTEVRNEVVKVFHSLKPIQPDEVDRYVVRGQYTESTINGSKVAGYRDEENVVSYTRTETYAALKIYIDNWRWGGVPFYIRTGKRLPTRVTEIVVHFKSTPHTLFCLEDTNKSTLNQLIIRIQPEEGLLLKIGMKLPGAGFQVKSVGMDFHYSDLGGAKVPGAYERLLLDCMLGDATLFARGDAVEACWGFMDPILKSWNSNEGKIFGYPAGTWGPPPAKSLFEEFGRDWRYPCKNLAEDGDFCEL